MMGESAAITESKLSFTSIVPRGQWPASVEDLPLLLRQEELAHLRGVTVRHLQRERRLGRSPFPWVKDGRSVLYPREGILARYGLHG